MFDFPRIKKSDRLPREEIILRLDRYRSRASEGKPLFNDGEGSDELIDLIEQILDACDGLLDRVDKLEKEVSGLKVKKDSRPLYLQDQYSYGTAPIKETKDISDLEKRLIERGVMSS